MIVRAISSMVTLVRVADVDRLVGVRLHQPEDAVDQVADVAEAARLRAVAEDR